MSQIRNALRVPVLCLALAFAAPAVAATAPANIPAPNAQQLTARIMEVDWNLKNSSVAARLDATTRARSERLLDRAREEIEAGHLKTAQGLIRQAAVPLVAMKPAHQAVAHPSRARELVEMRTTLKSISRGAEEIAREQGIENTLVADTLRVIRRSEELQRAGHMGVECLGPVVAGAVGPLGTHDAQVVHDVAAAHDQHAALAQRTQGAADGVVLGQRPAVVHAEL